MYFEVFLVSQGMSAHVTDVVFTPEERPYSTILLEMEGNDPSNREN